MRNKFIEWSHKDLKTSSLLSLYCSAYGGTMTLHIEGAGLIISQQISLKRKDLKSLHDYLSKILDMDIGFKKDIDLNKGDYEELLRMVEEYNDEEKSEDHGADSRPGND